MSDDHCGDHTLHHTEDTTVHLELVHHPSVPFIVVEKLYLLQHLHNLQEAVQAGESHQAN